MSRHTKRESLKPWVFPSKRREKVKKRERLAPFSVHKNVMILTTNHQEQERSRKPKANKKLKTKKKTRKSWTCRCWFVAALDIFFFYNPLNSWPFMLHWLYGFRSTLPPPSLVICFILITVQPYFFLFFTTPLHVLFEQRRFSNKFRIYFTPCNIIHDHNNILGFISTALI